jgi:signal peptidase I
MSALALAGVFVGMLILLLAASAACFWVMARCCGVADVSIRRAIALMLALAAMNIVLGGADLWLKKNVLASQSFIQGLVTLTAFLLELFVGFLIVKRVLRTNPGRALLVFITASVLTGAIGFGGAVLFRARFVESFIATTGSQALSIYGRHYDVKCFDCGYQFAVEAPYSGAPSKEQVATVCPNCGQTSWLDRGMASDAGDQFLIDRTAAPKRWDIVAFKSPTEPNTTYVKRLVGLPGETVAISHGHVFINGVEAHRDLGAKTDLWVPLIDTQFVASTAVPNWLHWAPAAGSHWTSAVGKWSCKAMDADGDELRLQGKITDWLAYNASMADRISEPLPTGDVKLECSIDSFSGNGDLMIHWEFAGHRLTATIASKGDATLDAAAVKKAADATTTKGNLSKPISTGQRLTIAVRDSRGYIAENDRVVASVVIDDEKFEADQPEDTESDGTVEPCKLSIFARRCDVSFSRIALFRDTYFRSATELPGRPSLGPAPVKLGDDEFFVLGDNSGLSNDSRQFGPIRANAMVGVARWILSPEERRRAFK